MFSVLSLKGFSNLWRALTLIGLILTLVLVSCKSEKYGSPINREVPTIKIKDVLTNKQLLGQTVKVEGIIATQCLSSGCWFVLKDETGQIFINLAPTGLSLPPKMGKKAVVVGELTFMNNMLMVVARGVEIR